MGELAVYDEFRAQLSEMKELNDSLTFDYADRKGNKEARSHVHKLRKTKTAIDAVRKREKQESLEYGRRVDSEAKEIIGEVQAMIDIHQGPIEEIERLEKERIEKYEQLIESINECANNVSENWLENSLDAMKATLAWISDEPETEDHWQEFLSTAMKAKSKAIDSIQLAIEKRVKYDAEQAELAALRAKQEEQAEKDREREKAEREAKIAEEAAALAKAEAEKAAQDKIKREREAAKATEQRLKAEAEKAKREKAELKERLEREAKEAKQREIEEAEKRERNKRHNAKINNAAVDALVSGGLDKEQAVLAVTLIAKRKVPAVTISY